MKDEQGFEGVWRTVRGRRVFIRSGEELGKAMERSGKFKNLKMSKEEKAEHSVLLRQQREKLRDKLNKGGLSKEEYEKIKLEIKKLTEEKQELDLELTADDLKEARKRLENKQSISKEKNIIDKVSINKKEIDDELFEKLSGIEKQEEEYGVSQISVEEITKETMDKIDELYENEMISESTREKYIDYANEKVSDIMYNKGYELYEKNGYIYYSMIPRAQKSYNDILDELDKKNLEYKISHSWTPGELPSIYVENENGQIFRIANHFNSKNQQIEAYSLKENKIYSTKDYINYKKTILKDLKEWLKENKE